MLGYSFFGGDIRVHPPLTALLAPEFHPCNICLFNCADAVGLDTTTRSSASLPGFTEAA